MIQERQTFEEFLNSSAAANLYKGTEAEFDKATQAALEEHFFEYFLCGPEEVFKKYYRHYLNVYYPNYIHQMRINEAAGTMDPFMSYYMEIKDSRITASEHEATSSKTGESTGSRSVEENGTTEKTRTPNITYTDNTTQTETNRTEETRTPNITESSTGNENKTETEDQTRTPSLTTEVSRTGTDTTAETGTVTTEKTEKNVTDNDSTSSTTTSSGGNVYGIAYPEASMPALPTDGTPPTISYASDGSYTRTSVTANGTGTTDETVTTNGTDEETRDTQSTTTHDTTDTTEQTGSETIEKSKTITGTESGTKTTTGTEKNVEEESKNVTNAGSKKETGTETEETEKTGTSSTTSQNSNTESGTESGTRKETTATGRQELGRGESTADILPRAIKAIRNSIPFLWFCRRMEECFDCYYY